MMMTLGGWFHLSGHPKALINLTQNPQGRLRNALAKNFVATWKETPQSALLGSWEKFEAHVAAIPPSEQITPPEFSKIAKQFFKGIAPSVDAALLSTKSDLAGLDLSQHDQGRLLLLTLIFGHRFYVDPMREWAVLRTSEAINSAWYSCFGTAKS